MSISKAWKEREQVSHNLRGTSIHNTWRAIRFTIKGKKSGCEERWKSFNNFVEDMYPTYQAGLRISRKDKAEPFSKENCQWVDPSDLVTTKTTQFEYNGQKKTFKEWALQYDLSLTGIMIRYHRRIKHKFTSHEILFGRKIKSRRIVRSGHELDNYRLRCKASKMIASYRCKDNKRGYLGLDLNIDWFIDNILSKDCIYCGTPDKIGADRINNNLGHTKINIVPACYRCNCVRNNHFTFEEMVKIGKFFKENIDPLITITSTATGA